MKKMFTGIFALVLCFSCFKGMAQEASPRLKYEFVNHSMAQIIKTLSTVYVPDMSKDEFSKKLGFNKELLEINEGKEFVDQLYLYCSNGATSEEVMRGDNSSLNKFVEIIIKGGNSTYPASTTTLAKRPWWKKLLGIIIKGVAILVGANNPEIPKDVLNDAADAIDGALGD